VSASEPWPAVEEMVLGVARERGFGELQASYADVEQIGLATFGCTSALVVLGLVVAVLVLVIGDYSIMIKAPIAAVVAVGAYLLARPDRELRRRRLLIGKHVHVFRNGVVHSVSHPGKEPETSPYAWSDVTNVNFVHTTGARDERHLYVMAATGPGFNVAPRHGTPEAQDVVRTIRANYDDHLVDAASEAIRRGGSFSFGGARVSGDGVQVGDVFTPWRQVAAVERTTVPRRGTEGAVLEVTAYHVARAGGGGSGGTVSYQELSSTSAFLHVAETLRRSAS